MWDQVSLGVGSFWIGCCGHAAHPHEVFHWCLTQKAARKSIVVAMILIGIFFVMVTLFGLGAAVIVSPQAIFAVDKGAIWRTWRMAELLGANILHRSLETSFCLFVLRCLRYNPCSGSWIGSVRPQARLDVFG